MSPDDPAYHWHYLPVLREGAACGGSCVVAGRGVLSADLGDHVYTGGPGRVLDLRWLTWAHASTRQAAGWNAHNYGFRTDDVVCRPADAPVLIEDHPTLCRGYFNYLAQGLKVTLRQGEPWLRLRRGRQRYQECPYANREELV